MDPVWNKKVYPATNRSWYLKTTGGIEPKNPYSEVFIRQLDEADKITNAKDYFFLRLDSNKSFEGAFETYNAIAVFNGRRYM